MVTRSAYVGAVQDQLNRSFAMVVEVVAVETTAVGDRRILWVGRATLATRVAAGVPRVDTAMIKFWNGTYRQASLN